MMYLLWVLAGVALAAIVLTIMIKVRYERGRGHGCRYRSIDN